jgi:alpha-L-rhamnosidase
MIAILSVLQLLVLYGHAACVVRPTHLSVDFELSTVQRDPVSDLPRVTDVAQPLLGWWLEPDMGVTAQNITQLAYRLVVASDPDLLPDRPDVIDSGWVVSNRSVSVSYPGSPLVSRARAFWQVAVRDSTGGECWSNLTGAWEVPLLADADWQGASWITRDAPHPPTPDCAYYADDAAPLFRKPFTLKLPMSRVLRARLYIAGLGYFTPYLDGLIVGDEVLAPGWTDFHTSVLYSTHDVTAAVRTGTDHVLGVALGRGWWDLAPLKVTSGSAVFC